ncbi:Major Facilitator Superfamily protein [Mucilaginibacter lappiensis]|uniref:MFS family permease n=1 Tax=Mucilaginibacter lappiensis TaxID=354630 RepID=A0ABR6PK98_9SPHI|nr:MFS transporter [Mucilaginibacter lappiensis]MBB6110061.1 MFS family permease [Mucilaginibacter lappiensis]SIR54104.1 Major Facilitator Superfamily protein [Mucilaginibacter lappiensis]
MNKQISRWFLLIILSSAVFLSVIDIFIVNVAIPSIKRGIHGSDSDIQLVIVLYLLGYAAFLITGGRAGDHYGKKNVFIVSMLLFVVTSYLCGFSQTAWQINTSRFLQGISAAFMIPQSITYIQELFPLHHDRIRALGIYGSIAGTASVIGQFLGGLLPDIHFLMDGWRLIFLINLPLGLIAVILAAIFLKDTKISKKSRFDYSGVSLLTLALITLIYPLVRGPELHWPWWSITSIALSLLLLYLFVLDQRSKLHNGHEPLVDVRLFSFKDFNIGLCAVLFYFMVQDTYFLINVILFQNGFGISSSETGIFFVFQGVGYVLASLLSLRLVPLYGKRVLQAGVLIMVTALLFHLVFFNSVTVSRYVLLPLLFIYGTGCGSVLPSLLTMALKSIPTQFAGAASGTFSTFQQTAIALGIGIVGGIFFYRLSGDTSLAGYISAYRLATSINIFLLAIVSLFLFLLPDKSQEKLFKP